MNTPAQGNGQAARRSPPLLIMWIGPPPTPERPFGVLELTLGRESNGYFLQPIPSDFGRAFQVTKLLKDGENAIYHVILDGRRSCCDCQGCQRWGHCKHLDALTLLLERGQLFDPKIREAKETAA